MNDFEHQVEKHFSKCLEIPIDKRVRYLEKTFGEEEAIRRRILELLEAYERANEFLESQPDLESRKAAKKMRRIAPSDENEGDCIGRYRLVRRIGEGTHGSVWLAEQTEDIKRRVALKILKLGMDTKGFLARFEVEKRILALLDHPCIAKVFDAGATDYGRPYFVMEYVEGKPLSEMADEAQLDIRDRVRIFIDVCRALQHAHSKGIIHRDLKPSNILTAKVDGKVVPKIIDFGVAKIANQEISSEDMMETMARVFVGTPVYASPEQLDESGRQLDYRSDIYSLGAVLYEFLTGRAPFEPSGDSTRSLDSLRSTIKTTDPQRPSKRIENLPEKDQTDIAKRRGCRAEKMPREIKGELDWVILKCLDKDPGRRYQKASELADDLEAWLRDEPVSAVAPSKVYRLRKFISRKRPAYAIWLEGSLAAVALLAVYLSVKLETRPPDRTVGGALSDLPGSLYRKTQKSIAVLPFDNSSGLESDRSLVNGIYLDLLTQLSKISGIKTISARSVRGYRNTDKDSVSIGEELGVSNLLTGEVENIGDRIQVSVYLEEVSTGAYLWSESYERKLDTAADIFSIRNHISYAVAQQLETVLSPEELRSIERVPTQNLKALEAYFKGKEILATDLRARMQEAGEYFQKAIDLDPEFAQAYAGLADSILGRTGVWGGRLDPFITLEESQELSIGLISRALELNPDLAEGHTLQGRLHREMEDYSQAEASYKRALEINPNYALAWNEYASMQKDKDAMFAMVRKSIELDPANAEFRPDLILQLCWFGRFDEALAEAEKLTRSNPDYPPGYWLAAAIWMDAFGRYDKGVEWLRKGSAVDPRDVWVNNYLVMAYEFLGDPDEAARWQELKMTLSRDPPDFLQQFDLHRLKGEDEEALEDCREYIRQGGDSFRAWRYVLNADLRAGQFDEARDRYERVAPYLFENDPILEVGGGRDFTSRYEQPRMAMQLAAVLYGAGDVEQATKLLDRGWELFKERPLMGSDGRFGYGIRDAVQLALKGEKRKALDAFREAIEAGYRDKWFLDCAELDPLRDDPEFIELEKVINDELTRQLANVRRMEEGGELAPYPELFLKTFGISEYAADSVADPEINFKPNRRSIAILPFDDHGFESEGRYLTDGIHEELLSTISRINSIRTIARASALSYKDTNKSMSAIGEELGVRWILEGGIERSEDRIRVDVSLIDTESEEYQWTKSYTRQVSAANLFAIQSEIATLIADSLKAVISLQEKTRIEKLPTQSWEAMEAYFKGRENEPYGASKRSFEKAVDYYEQAIELDPDFALAHASLAEVSLKLVVRGLPREEQLPKAERHIRRALELDGALPEAYLALARLRRLQRDSAGAKEAYQKVLEFDSSNARAYFGLARMEEEDEATRLYLKAYELDPKNPESQDGLINVLLNTGQEEEAIELRKRLASEDPWDPGLLRKLMFAYRSLGRYDDAIIALRKALDLASGTSDLFLALNYLSLGDIDKASWWFDRIPVEDEYFHPYAAIWKSKLDGRDGVRKSLALEMLSRDPRNPFALGNLTEIDLASGAEEEALLRLEGVHPELFDFSVEITSGNVDAALLVAQVWLRSGEEDKARQLISRILAVAKTTRLSSLRETVRDREARAHAILGDVANTIKSIKRSFDRGASPFMFELRDDFKPFLKLPEYQAVADGRKAELAIQLNRIRKLEAEGGLGILP